MRAKGKQVLSIIVFIIFFVLVYLFYADKFTFQWTTKKSEEDMLGSSLGPPTAEQTIGKVITRNQNGWTIDNVVCKKNYDFVLAHLKSPPHTPIFVYSAKEDVWVSGNIIRDGQWEGGLVQKILGLMQKHPNAIFLDLGANVGMFSVSIAAHGFRTIAVDCLEGNVMRLCASMKAAKLTDKMTVVYNALSHTHEKVSLGKHKGNVGGTFVKGGTDSDKDSVNTIFLDDLLEIYSFDQVVIKMDVETYEANVLKGAYNFFKTVKVHALLMEFVAHRNKDSGRFIADFLTSHGLEPNVPESVKSDYSKWGGDVLFLRNEKSSAVLHSTTTTATSTQNMVTINNPEQAFGKVIAHTNGKWISDENFCPSDTSRFVSARLGHPYNVPIFVYTAKEDQWISGRIINGGVWEDDLVNKIITQVNSYPEAFFIDIGANIGVYTMAVASRNRKVISVDCLRKNLDRLCNSVRTAGFTDRVSIVNNALSSERTTFSLGSYEGNVGGTYLKKSSDGSDVVHSILLDDLLTLFPLKEAVIKMDVETHEDSVLKGASKFFKDVKVQFIMLEFVAHKGKESGRFIKDFFEQNEMEPILPLSANLEDTKTWPNEVSFRRKKGPSKNSIQEQTTHANQEGNHNEISQVNPSNKKIIKSEKQAMGKVISRSGYTQEWTESNISCQVQSHFIRANLNRDPSTPIFVYSKTEDKWVSGSIIANGNWEYDLVQKIISEFRQFPDATFLDVGANVGMFSLTLAKLGKKVIAFECLKGNVERLCASMKNNPGFEERMTIVYNALSNKREKVTLGTHSGNVGGTYVKKLDPEVSNVNIIQTARLDDILELFVLKKVIMKMDVETYEAKVLEGAQNFFNNVEVEAVLMEFVAHRGKDSGKYIIEFFEKHKMYPVLSPGMDRHDTNTWKKGEVMFKKQHN